MTGKEAFGALERSVEVHQPVCDRRPRREDEGRIGARSKFERLTLDDEVRHHPSPIFDDSNWLIISPEMVNDRLLRRTIHKLSGSIKDVACPRQTVNFG